MKTILSIFIILLCSVSYAHKHYITLAEMEYEKETNQINVSLKATAHDVEYILEKHFNQKVHLENIADSSVVGKFIIEYLRKSFKIFNQGESLTLHYLGKEVLLNEELYFYFSFPVATAPASIEVQNSFLTEFFKGQQNIVNYKFNNTTKSVTLSAEKTKASIKF